MAPPEPRLEDLIGVPRRGPGWLAGMALGALCGALVTWLTLPVRGAELRRLLRESWLRLIDRLSGRDDRLV